ncbi:MAG: ATP-binding cassette domain-containing protein, partial [Chloroflexales bacterium]|nr:ATP-binding cassette domain-containing protein [Chloroflexales bacterium]
MLQVQRLRKDYGAATILSDISFIINDSEHVGLIGPNGVGKSTLLRCIIGQERPDQGNVVLAPTDLAIGYLAQAFDARLGKTIGAVVATAQAEFVAAEQALQHASAALSTTPDLDPALAGYAEALARFEALGGYEREHRTAAILDGLGLGAITEDTAVATLSGG